MPTAIQWTDETWNCLVGCSLVSEGCRNCYAMRVAERMESFGQEKYKGLTHRVNGHPVWTGEVRLHEGALELPLKWKKPRRIFVNSMSDLFHERVTDAMLNRIWTVMMQANWHTYQILTKRPERLPQAVAWLTGGGVAPPHVWLGTSVENQETAEHRIPFLLRTSAAVRWISAEPLLGPIDFCDEGSQGPFSWLDLGIRWVVVGGESGPGARPCRIEDVRGVVRQCQSAGVSVFVKQLGAVPVMDEAVWRRSPSMRLLKASHHLRAPTGTVPIWMNDAKGGDIACFPHDLQVREYPECP